MARRQTFQTTAIAVAAADPPIIMGPCSYKNWYGQRWIVIVARSNGKSRIQYGREQRYWL